MRAEFNVPYAAREGGKSSFFDGGRFDESLLTGLPLSQRSPDDVGTHRSRTDVADVHSEAIRAALANDLTENRDRSLSHAMVQ